MPTRVTIESDNETPSKHTVENGHIEPVYGLYIVDSQDETHIGISDQFILTETTRVRIREGSLTLIEPGQVSLETTPRKNQSTETKKITIARE